MPTQSCHQKHIEDHYTKYISNEVKLRWRSDQNNDCYDWQRHNQKSGKKFGLDWDCEVLVSVWVLVYVELIKYSASFVFDFLWLNQEFVLLNLLKVFIYVWSKIIGTDLFISLTLIRGKCSWVVNSFYSTSTAAWWFVLLRPWNINIFLIFHFSLELVFIHGVRNF